jgi:hypothetical protein
VTFNINSQTGGVINNVAGDQRIAGGQQGTIVSIEAARDAVRGLEQAITAAPLSQSAATEARGHLDEVDAEMRKDAPDRPTVADRLRRLTDLLASTGSLASAGAAMAGPLRTLASWLGSLGEPIVRALALLL